MVSRHKEEHGLNRCLTALRVSKGTWPYRQKREGRQAEVVAEEQRLKTVVVEIIEEHPAYGYRRLSPELEERGEGVNDKRLRRLLSEWDLSLVRTVARPRPSGVREILHRGAGKLNLVKGWSPEPLEMLSTDFTEFRYAGGSKKSSGPAGSGERVGAGLAGRAEREPGVGARVLERGPEASGRGGRGGGAFGPGQRLHQLRVAADLIVEDGVVISFSENGAKDNPWIESFWNSLQGREPLATLGGADVKGSDRDRGPADGLLQHEKEALEAGLSEPARVSTPGENSPEQSEPKLAPQLVQICGRRPKSRPAFLEYALRAGRTNARCHRFRVGPRRRWIVWGGTLQDVLGFRPERFGLSLDTWIDSFLEEDQPLLREAILTRGSRGAEIDISCRLRDPTGTVRRVRVQMLPSTGMDAEALLGVVVVAERPEPVGATAWRIVRLVQHEINNPLAIIMGQAQLLLTEQRPLQSEVELRRALETIYQQGQRIAGVIKRLTTTHVTEADRAAGPRSGGGSPHPVTSWA